MKIFRKKKQLPTVDPSFTFNVVKIRPFCSISIVNIRLLLFDVDAVILMKSSAIVTVGMVDLELRPSAGQC